MDDDIVAHLSNLSSARDWETTKYLCTEAAEEILSCRGTIRALDEEIEWLLKIVEGLLAGCSHRADGDLPFGECEWHTAYMAYRSKYPAQMNEYQKMWAEKLKESNNE